MKIKTRELKGKALDWAVAKCEGFGIRNNYEVSFCDEDGDILLFHCMADDTEHAVEQCVDAYPNGNSFDAVRLDPYHPATNRAQGGEIIEEHDISVWLTLNGLSDKGKWSAAMPHWFEDDPVVAPEYEAFYGDTQLQAAMRCFVQSRLGDEVEVPEEVV